MQKNLGAKVSEHEFLGTPLYLFRKSNGRNCISYKFWEPVIMTKNWKTRVEGLEGMLASMSGFKDHWYTTPHISSSFLFFRRHV